MLGELITSSLVLILGYAYPAMECFKTIEKRDVGNAELRFWCQYWVIIAILTVFERVGDIFISWVPMYGELKLALIIYLWYPKTKGTGFVYDAMLRPFIIRHETDIEKSLKQFRDKAWDVAIYYWQNSTELGQTKFFEIFQYLISKPLVSRPTSQGLQNHQSSNDGHPPPPPMTPTPTLFGLGSDHGDNNRWTPSAPPVPTASHHHNHHGYAPEPPLPSSPTTYDSSSTHKEPVWLRFRRSRGL
ncbi:putative HVA22-like protein g [Tanacetum coccineum]